MLASYSFLLLGATLAFAGQLEQRQSNCAQVHVFGARETTVSPGYGTSGPVVNSILSAFPGATSEAITYPACGGQSSCGGISYGNSALQGTAAVASQVNAYNQRCPNAILVLVGYSQGGQIMDNAYCGGGDTNIGLSNTAIPISTAAQAKIAAAIFMGDPRHIPGLPYNVGTCQASGFAPRPAGFQCPYASNVQSYCDSPDPYCCNGNDQNAHQAYANKYGSNALTFVRNKVNALLNGGGGGTTPQVPSSTSQPTGPTNPPTGAQAPRWGQCGGQGWTGPTSCVPPYTCQAANAWYSQCL
ncbi:hypothetical protein HGRIS_000782 [Hohenbuehelia grisea]|uniref:CBM1 domain-containing protein n=1 Tax=Hohenbuehelia grisea TaxID=104357 RepID=A0ABR3IPP1_9AGAR